MIGLGEKIVFLMRWQLAVIIMALGITGTTVPAEASTTSSVVWTSQADFEFNVSTMPVPTPTTRANIDTTTNSGDIKIGVTKDFVTTATITCATSRNKIYNTGVDRTSIAVVDSSTKAVTGTIPLPARAAGVVYNSANNKLYVGQYNDNKVLVIDVSTDTIIHTLTVGNGAYAAAYNSTNNKVYIANTGDQTVTILDGVSDSLLVTVPVTAGATTAVFDAIADKVYLTSKSNQYMTILDGATDQIVQDVGIDPPVNLLGGQAPSNVGLRVDASAKGIGSANALHLSWNYDTLGSNQKIQFQVRTAADVPSLDSAIYKGPDGTVGTWYDLSTSGAVTTTESDGTETTSVTLNSSYTPAVEIQVMLSSDGLSTPVMHSVTLGYEIYPDLVTTSVIGPATGTIGSSISVTSAVTSQGGVPAGSFKVGLYLTKSSVDTFLGDRTVASLAAGGTDTASTTVTIPAISTGNYTLKACADYTNLVTETNEDNNCSLGSTISIYSVQPDLVVTAVTPPPSAVTGQGITVPVTLKNQGGATLSVPVNVGLYVCPTSTISTSCTSFGSMNFGELTPGQSRTYNFNVTVPTLTSGTYYIGAIADPYNTIQEYDETNNTRAGNSTSITYGPDLAVTAVTPPPSAVTGQGITVPVTLKNQGTGSTLSAPVNVGLYVCPTSTISTSCTSFGYMNFGGLTPGQSRTYNFNVTVPTLTSWTYYIGAIADPDNIIPESYEDNNTRAGTPTSIN